MENEPRRRRNEV